MRAAGLIVAAGRGSRAGKPIPKQYEVVAGKPLIRWSAEAMAASAAIDRVAAVVHPSDEHMARDALAGLDRVEFTLGAEARTGSVRAGLAALAQGAPPEAVLIHDAARPGLTDDMIAALLSALQEADGAAPALPCPDAIKRVESNWVSEDVARGDLRRVQTPQAFRFEAIVRAFDALPADASYEDDIAVARAAGLRVRLIEGNVKLAKVTFPEDFDAAARVLGAQGVPLIGSGFDAHRFGPGDFVTLCGVRIAHTHGLVGHSDADAAWHALTDAILGALGQGDIGDHFPPTDMQWRGAPSEVFLAHARDLAVKAGARIVNVDITLICETPKIKPHREAMRARTAAVLNLPLPRVSVKATTTEALGFLGRKEGLAAQASALLLGPG